MLKKSILVFVIIAVFSVFSCTDKNTDSPAMSMEQLHAEYGQPVSVRELVPQDFSVYLKYSSIIQASSESTAYANINDVVRRISARVGDTVKQDDVIISFSSDNQTLVQATLAYENARNSFNRTTTMYNSNFISRQDFEIARMQYEIARTNLKAANDMVFVKAPISGTITQINVHLTENVRPGTPLFTVSNQDGYEARFYVGASEIDKIHTGARAFINNPDDKLEGRITQVSMTMDSQRQAFPVTAFFSAENRRWASGMSIDISVEIHRNENALVLLRRELVQTKTGLTAFVVEGEEVKQVEVQTGEEKGLRLEILSGLSEGDLIVSEGAQFIKAESKINIVPSILAQY